MPGETPAQIMENAEIEAAAEEAISDAQLSNMMTEVSSGDVGSLAAPVELSRQEYVRITHRVTGRVVPLPPNIARAKLIGTKFTATDDCPPEMVGQRVWRRYETGDDAIPENALKCRFANDDPERARFTALGLGHIVCGKANIPNMNALELHMQHKHKQPWQALKDQEDRAERDEQRDLQRATLEAQRAMMDAFSNIVAKPKEAPRADTVQEKAQEAKAEGQSTRRSAGSANRAVK
jgi:hypothetical protein